MRATLLLVALLLLTAPTLAQTTGTVRGTVRMADGKPLPYAALTAKSPETTGRANTGTMANADGQYELKLAPGRYELVFQYLGFQTRQQPVEVGTNAVTIDVTMTEQVTRLAEVNVKKGSEDPAYSIMRRAIAKARFHQLQVQSFTARAYQKASFTILKLPLDFLYRDQLKKAEAETNFKVGVPILTETVSDVSFTQPNTYRQRVVATRNSLPPQAQVDPSPYFLSSFYNPTVNRSVSPLSPKAFAYYKFSYEGTFREAGPNGTAVDISKIGVTPRGYGEGVFQGTIFIIEDTWAIHSLQLETRTEQGFTLGIRQVYTPVRGVWMPTNIRYNLDGSYLGVGLTGQFIISQTFKQFQINPTFVDDVKVLDEKYDKPAVTLSNKVIAGQKFGDVVAKQKEFSTKNLKQLVKEYEKQEYKARKERREDVAVTRNDSITIDSLARRPNPAIWDSLRTVPLTTAESRAYNRGDSLQMVRDIKMKRDSLSGKNKTARRDTTSRSFNAGQLLFGHTWPLTKRATLRWDDIITSLQYNTIEGYTLNAGLRYGFVPDKKRGNEFSLRADGRYEFFGRHQFLGYGTAAYRHKTSEVSVSGGRYVAQYNPNNPVSPSLNTMATLVFGQNLMKLYQKDYFLNLNATAKPLDGRITLTGSLELAQRSELTNYRDDLRPWIGWFGNRFTPNRPVNAEDRGPVDAGAAMPTHQALTLSLLANGQFGKIRYRIRNGEKRNVRTTGPRWLLNYRRGLADVDYDFVQGQVRHSIETGIRSRLDVAVGAGTFLTSNKLYLPDFKHFAGNEFFLLQGDPLTQFRLLPYYQYSTKSRFAEAHALIEFRQLLLTQIIYARLAGLKEDLFVHYLATPASRNYTEVGYALDGLIPGVLPFFRVEVIGQFQDFTYQGLGVRVGTTLKFGR